MICNCSRHTGPESEAVGHLRCAECGKVFGRCAACAKKPGSLKSSMKAHWECVHIDFVRRRFRRSGFPYEKENPA